jgi:hypothetical protein
VFVSWVMFVTFVIIIFTISFIISTTLLLGGVAHLIATQQCLFTEQWPQCALNAPLRIASSPNWSSLDCAGFICGIVTSQGDGSTSTYFTRNLYPVNTYATISLID